MLTFLIVIASVIGYLGIGVICMTTSVRHETRRHNGELCGEGACVPRPFNHLSKEARIHKCIVEESGLILGMWPLYLAFTIPGSIADRVIDKEQDKLKEFADLKKKETDRKALEDKWLRQYREQEERDYKLALAGK